MNSELHSFQHFLTSQTSDMSPEEALDMWRQDHPVTDETAETVAALRIALAEMDAGERGVPLAEFNRNFYEQHGLGAPQ